MSVSPSPAQPPDTAIRPRLATQPVRNDPDDPAIWIHPKYPYRSRIIATNKVSAAEGGAIYVYGLDGSVQQRITGIDRPNNVDVEYDVHLNGTRMDIAVVTERNTRRLRIFRIYRSNGMLAELVRGGIPVFEGETDEAALPMGVSLYRRPGDGAVFVIVGRKSGPTSGYLWQYALKGDGKGGVAARKVRAFGAYSGKKEIESIFVDDALGYVYYSDEGFGVRKYYADPNHTDADKELAVFASDNFVGDHEGIALYATGPRTGYLLCTDQRTKEQGGSVYRVFTRAGEPGKPHEHREVARLNGGADETDGIDATSHALGRTFRKGVLVVMNSRSRNFLIFDGAKILQTIQRKR